MIQSYCLTCAFKQPLVPVSVCKQVLHHFNLMGSLKHMFMYNIRRTLKYLLNIIS